MHLKCKTLGNISRSLCTGTLEMCSEVIYLFFLNIAVDGNWEPLLKATNRCMFSVVEHPEGVVISVRYAPCLIKKVCFEKPLNLLHT